MATVKLKPAPSAGVEIGSIQQDAIGEARVGSILLNVWNHVSKAHRTAIVAHWRKRFCVPQVVLLDPWPGTHGADASCLSEGDTIWMNWARTSSLPDCRIEPILAHEMAHVLQWATGKDRQSLTADDISGEGLMMDPNRLGPRGRIEVHADQVIETWGYSALENLVWIRQHTQEKNGKYVLRKRPLSERRVRSKAKLSQLHSYFCDLQSGDDGTGGALP